jgi:hypothetical protein
MARQLVEGPRQPNRGRLMARQQDGGELVTDLVVAPERPIALARRQHGAEHVLLVAACAAAVSQATRDELRELPLGAPVAQPRGKPPSLKGRIEPDQRMHRMQQLLERAAALFHQLSALGAEDHAQDDVERDVQHRIIGTHVLARPPGVRVMARNLMDGAAIAADALGGEPWRQQLAFAAMPCTSLHPQRAAAGDAGECRLVKGIVFVGVAREHLSRAFCRQCHHERGAGRAYRRDLAVPAAQPGIELPGLADEGPRLRRMPEARSFR